MNSPRIGGRLRGTTRIGESLFGRAGAVALVATLVAWSAGSGCASGEATGSGSGWGEDRIDALRVAMPELLRAHSVPGAAVVLIDGAEIEWATGFGVTAPGGEPVAPTTVFQAASLGKPVFAQLVHGIARERAWTLDDSIAAWAPPGSHPPDLGSATAAELLGHTAGLVYDADTDRVTFDPQLRGRWRYSGAGYVLLQRAVEASERRGLNALARERLVDPLGLETMGFLAPEGATVAVGHDRDGRPLSGAGWTDPNAASSLHTSALDYARFLIHASGLGGDAPGPWERLTAARVVVREEIGLRWGLGWALERPDVSSRTAAFHWGSNPGFKSFALVDRERGIGLVILTNGDNGLELVEDAVGIVDAEPHPVFEFYMLHPDD
ncbi:MAG: serine hydrolase domain-containing protein [Gemmatimonadota bacterium]